MRHNRSFPSPLARDFEANREVYKQTFSVNGRMDWIALSQAVTAKGLVNADGPPPSAACCRLTWYRLSSKLKRLSAGKRAHRRSSPSVVVSDEVWSSLSDDDLSDKDSQSAEKSIQPGKKRNNDDV